MNRWISLMALAVLVFLGACGPPQYTKDDLDHMGAKEEVGTVTRGSRGSFVLRGDSGSESTYRTWQKTQYIPESYRPLEGDRIRVAYQGIPERSGRTKLAAMQVEALEVPAANQSLASPVTGILTRRTFAYDLYVQQEGSDPKDPHLVFRVRHDSVVKPRRGLALAYPDPFALAGAIPLWAKVRVEFVREPLARGNGYYYKITQIQEL